MSSTSTSYAPTAISPFSSVNSLLSEPTSDDQPDLGAFRTVFRALTDLHALPTTLSRRQLSIESTSTTTDTSNVDSTDDSASNTNPWSTVWTHGPLNSYLQLQRQHADFSDGHGDEDELDTTSDDDRTTTSASHTTNQRSQSRSPSNSPYISPSHTQSVSSFSHSSSFHDDTLHARAPPPPTTTSVEDSETPIDSDTPEDQPLGEDMEGSEGENVVSGIVGGGLGGHMEADDVQLSLGYLNETLSFIAAERVRLAALRGSSSSNLSSKSSLLLLPPAITAEGASIITSSTSGSEPRRTPGSGKRKAGHRRSKRNGSIESYSSILILQRPPTATTANSGVNKSVTAISDHDRDHSDFEADGSNSSSSSTDPSHPSHLRSRTHPTSNSKSHTKSHAKSLSTSNNSKSISKSSATKTKLSSSSSSSTNRRPKRTKSTPLLPSALPSTIAVTNPSSSTVTLTSTLTTTTTHTPRNVQVDPRLTRFKSLASKLRVHFPSEVHYLRQLLSLRTRVEYYIGTDDEEDAGFVDPRGPTPEPDDPATPLVHVFIDHSNILVGLITYIKRHPHLLPDPTQRRNKISLSHAALTLVLERGRPVSRRVIVASSPLYQPMESAMKLGYEVRIYARVPRVDDAPYANNGGDVTPRKGAGKGHARRISAGAVMSSAESTSASASDSAGGGGHGTPSRTSSKRHSLQMSQLQSSTNTNTSITNKNSAGNNINANANASGATSRVRYREQGVDELLQLKIHDALSQSDERPPKGSTIILATGDGNAGQFSEEGFIGPIRVALRKGWNVEIYSWEEGLSRAWKREFEDWGKERFKIVGMERFASDLVEV